MTDPHDLVERVREMSQQGDPSDGLQLPDRTPPSQAQRERVDDAAIEAAPPPAERRD